MANFSDLLGKTLKNVTVEYTDDPRIRFETEDDKRYVMYHRRECCEGVGIEEIIGNLDDLVGSPITEAAAESDSSSGGKERYDESYTWTFYKIGTAKGFVTIRWYGSSNGCYSESVDFVEVGS